MTTELTTSKTPISMGANGEWKLQTIDDAWRFATAVCKSGLAPQHFKTPEQVIIAMQHGAEIGLSPMQSLQSIAVINGRPSLWGDALPALVWASGKCASIREWVDGSDESMVAYCETTRVGQPLPKLTSFSVADAKKAQLWGKSGPWQSYPKRMLAMRARAYNFRDQFADALKGLGIAEEQQDIQPAAPTGGRTLKLSDIPDEPIEAEIVPDTEVAPAAEATDTPDMDAILEALNNCKTPSQVKDIESYWEGNVEVASLCKSRLDLMTVQKKKSTLLPEENA